MSKHYDATREFSPLARSKDYNGQHPRSRRGGRQYIHRKLKGVHRQGPNVRVLGRGQLQVKLASGGTVTLSDSGRTHGNGAFFRLRDGVCVSHVTA